MKKLVCLIASIMMIGQVSKAAIAISWGALGGFYNYNVVGSPVDPNDYCNFGSGSAMAYLVYSSDAVRDFDYSNAAGQYLANGDYVLTSVLVNATDWGNFDVSTYTDLNPIQGGYVYARIIDNSAPGGGSQYFDSVALLTTAWVAPATPQDLVVNSDNFVGDKMIQVVPEPTVLAFLGIGAALVGVRRMRRA